jgi:protein TonB
VTRTKHQKEKPPPPAPRVPVEAPTEERLDKEQINLDPLDLGDPSPEPFPDPPSTGGEGDKTEPKKEVFITVEQKPKLKGGRKALQECLEYPDMAKRAGVEGRMTVQFVVNKKGNVKKPRILGEKLGAGLNEEAIRCVEKMDFKPGKQRGEPVNVQFAVPVHFFLD